MLPDFPIQHEILTRLLAMVKINGGAVWYNDGGDYIRVRNAPFGEPESYTWSEAAQLTGVDYSDPVKRKGTGRGVSTLRLKGKRVS